MRTLRSELKIAWKRSNTASPVELSPVDLVLHVGGTVDQPEIALVERAEQALREELAHQRLVFLQHGEMRDDRFGRDDEIAIPVGAVDRGLDALLEIGDQIARIAAEDLVAALPAEHDLDVLRRQLRDHELRKRAGTGDRMVEVIDHLLDMVAEVARVMSI